MAEATISPNRIELESQILCASLRQSWNQKDVAGAIVVAKQLSQLFPDLLPPLTQPPIKPLNLYEYLGLKYDCSPNIIISAHSTAIQRFLQKHDVKKEQEKYHTLIDAGYVLRKPRLRLSHDLVLVRDWLLQQKAIPADGSIDFIPIGPQEKIAKAVLEVPRTLPSLVNLLKEAQIVGAPEVLALVNQKKLAPEVPIEELILSAGYVSEAELKSLQLADYLLQQGKITMPQFAVAMYDERTRGIRMAESLQSRGWLEVEVKPSTQK